MFFGEIIRKYNETLLMFKLGQNVRFNDAFQKVNIYDQFNFFHFLHL